MLILHTSLVLTSIFIEDVPMNGFHPLRRLVPRFNASQIKLFAVLALIVLISLI